MGNVFKCLKSEYQVVSQDDSEDIYETLITHNKRILNIENKISNDDEELEQIKCKIDEIQNTINIYILTLEEEQKDNKNIIKQLKEEFVKVKENSSLVQRKFNSLGDVLNSMDMSIHEDSHEDSGGEIDNK